MEEEQAYKIKLKIYSDPPPKRRVVFFDLTPTKLLYLMRGNWKIEAKKPLKGEKEKNLAKMEKRLWFMKAP
jgi:hypothetical protein